MTKVKIGDAIRIDHMEGDLRYTGKEGVIQNIGTDPWGDMYFSGTWGGCNVYPDIDSVTIIKEG